MQEFLLAQSIVLTRSAQQMSEDDINAFLDGGLARSNARMNHGLSTLSYSWQKVYLFPTKLAQCAGHQGHDQIRESLFGDTPILERLASRG